MQLWVRMDQVKAHYPIFLSGKKGYDISGEIIYENQNLFDLEIEERAHKGIFLAFQYPSRNTRCKYKHFS